MTESNSELPTIKEFQALRDIWSLTSITKPPPEGLSAEQSLQIVQNFVHQVWNHPLVTPELLEFRQKGNLFMNKISAELGLQGKAVGIPVGSCIWAKNKSSDWDYVVLTSDAELLRKIRQNRKKIRQDNNLQLICTENPINIDNLDLNKHYQELFSLFVAPDEMLVGNVNLAQQYRLAIAQQSGKNAPSALIGVEDDAWLHYFANEVKGWPVHKNEGTSLKQAKHHDRYKRFTSLLTLRSSESKIKDYVKQYMLTLDRFRAPSVRIFLPALTLSNGALHLPKNPSRTTGI